MSSLTDLFKKASKIWSLFEDESGSKLGTSDGEIIYSKNNVCVHQSSGDGFFTHFPGYLSVRVQNAIDENSTSTSSTLILSWISNTVLRRDPKTVESVTPSNTPIKRKTCQSPSSESQRSWSQRTSRRHSFQSISGLDETYSSEVRPEDITAALKSMILDGDDSNSNSSIEITRTSKTSSQGSPLCCDNNEDSKSRKPELVDCKGAENIFNFQDYISGAMKYSRSQTPSGYASGRISPAVTPTHELYGRYIVSENAALNGIFCVDLRQMKSLRLFFSSAKNGEIENTNGQLVIASRESQYKIFHFHNGGLDKLSSVLKEFDFLVQSNVEKKKNCESNFIHYSVCKPEISAEECHPEEGVYRSVDKQMWKCDILNELGQVEDDFTLRKIIFFAGICEEVRKEIWPFLLRRFDYMSTFEERQASVIEKAEEYKQIDAQRKQMNDEERELFWRNVECTVEKDVPRTDRSNPFFAGENNKNIETMKRILLNYAFYNPSMGYTQGMSDLLAPILIEMLDESETFWCFVGLMQRTLFICSPKDVDMDANLTFLRELIRIMLPDFYNHLKSLPDALELLFAHRWVLLCFKREFPEQEAFKIWESCWAHYQTDYFHLFICLSIISIYGTDVLECDMRGDEILLHFSTLTMHMNGDLVLRKARGLLYQFRLLPKVSCILEKMCLLCGPGIWDSGHTPAIECIRNFVDSDDVLIRCSCFKE
ncbi:TBC1 domain family member 16-like isoform X3, partial [Leptotrombidium deliense]